jgi:hypothetical protein
MLIGKQIIRMEEKAKKFQKLFKQESFLQKFNSRTEISILFDLLSEEEIDALNKENTVFIRSYSPSSRVVLGDIEKYHVLNIINFDQDYYDKLSPEEFIGILLHEIAHILYSETKYATAIDAEYIADDFANKKGFGRYIISCLEKGLKHNWLEFREDSCHKRISMLKSNPLKTFGIDEL